MSTIDQIKSYFEIHITVDSNDMYYFMLFCNEHNCSYDYAVGPYLFEDKVNNLGSNNQLMYTKTINATYEEAIVTAKSTKKELEAYGVKVVRVKLEVPANHNFVHKFADLHPKYGKDKDIGYFEFHFKVTVTNKEEHGKMCDISKKHDVSFSYNAFGRTKDKVLVAQRVRVHPDSYDKALKLRQKYIDDLVENGLNIETNGSGVHYEFVVYDDNKELDNGFVDEAIQC